MPKGHKRSSRTTTFGLPNGKTTKDITNDVRNALKKCELFKLRLAKPNNRKFEFPLKRLRSDLAKAMCLDVVYCKRSPGYHERYRKTNPEWGGMQHSEYKANKVCNMLQPLVTHGFKANVVHDLVRLSINIWRMPKKGFNGLISRILSKIVFSSKSPEAELRFVALSSNPVLNHRVYWFARNQSGPRTRGPAIDPTQLGELT